MKAQALLPLMIDTASAAGSLAMRYRDDLDSMEVRFKGQADLLCEADEEVERVIYERLSQAHPDIGFWGEEGGKRGPADAGLSWVVDPIDGTTNFLSGLPFAVSIALARGLEPLAGVIYAPLTGEMFSAAVGSGAWLNAAQIKVRHQTETGRMVVGTGLPLDQHNHALGAYDRLHLIREEVAAVRILGSCALSLAHVACGRLDGYFEGPTGFLDCAAGLVILQEAGGVVSDFWGEQNHTRNVTYTAGSETCHRFLTSVTQTAPRGGA